jgi:hypothetical protein
MSWAHTGGARFNSPLSAPTTPAAPEAARWSHGPEARTWRGAGRYETGCACMGWPLLVHYLLPFPDDVRLERQTLTACLPASQCQTVPGSASFTALSGHQVDPPDLNRPPTTVPKHPRKRRQPVQSRHRSPDPPAPKPCSCLAVSRQSTVDTRPTTCRSTVAKQARLRSKQPLKQVTSMQITTGSRTRQPKPGPTRVHPRSRSRGVSLLGIRWPPPNVDERHEPPDTSLQHPSLPAPWGQPSLQLSHISGTGIIWS